MIGIILLIPIIYLVYVYNKNGGWTNPEQLIFLIILVAGLINSLMLFYQKKGTKIAYEYIQYQNLSRVIINQALKSWRVGLRRTSFRGLLHSGSKAPASEAQE
jgi:hypothetical protein